MTSKGISTPLDQDKKIIQIKYSGPHIGTMSEQNLMIHSKALLLKIHVICGWKIPSKELQIILKDQFKKKLVEDYSNMNTAEIEYAFRQDTQVKDWGKEMNLNLIDQVLIPYLEKRFKASEAEEKKEKAPVQKVYTDEELDNLTRRDLEEAYQAMRNGKQPLIYDTYAEILVKDGFIEKPSQVNDFFVSCLNNSKENLYIRD